MEEDGKEDQGGSGWRRDGYRAWMGRIQPPAGLRRIARAAIMARSCPLGVHRWEDGARAAGRITAASVRALVAYHAEEGN